MCTLIADFYIWVCLLINQAEEVGEKRLLVFSFKVGQINPLIHVHVAL